VTPAEARRLLRLANVEALKRRLGDGEVIPYADLLRACEEAGAARTRAEAAALAGALDEAGVVLLFRDRVYLQPNKVSRASESFASPYILLKEFPRRVGSRFGS
jgi:calcium uniporter protein, mitochondrial